MGQVILGAWVGFGPRPKMEGFVNLKFREHKENNKTSKFGKHKRPR